MLSINLINTQSSSITLARPVLTPLPLRARPTDSKHGWKTCSNNNHRTSMRLRGRQALGWAAPKRGGLEKTSRECRGNCEFTYSQLEKPTLNTLLNTVAMRGELWESPLPSLWSHRM